MDDEGQSATFTPFWWPVHADDGVPRWNLQGGVAPGVGLLHGRDGDAVFGHVVQTHLVHLLQCTEHLVLGTFW